MLLPHLRPPFCLPQKTLVFSARRVFAAFSVRFFRPNSAFSQKNTRFLRPPTVCRIFRLFFLPQQRVFAKKHKFCAPADCLPYFPSVFSAAAISACTIDSAVCSFDKMHRASPISFAHSPSVESPMHTIFALSFSAFMR